MLSRLPVEDHHRRLLGQLIRFAISGGLLTIGCAGGYLLLATWGGMQPNVAMTVSFIVFTGIGYLLHSHWSFKDHGSRDGQVTRTIRFVTVNTIGFLSNQAFVWLLVEYLGGPEWWPVIPIVFVTPLLTFSLNRQWVFS
jgi:putative flippase GtrA